MILEPLEGFTLLLGVATVWLAIATSRMASATKRAVTLEAEPHVALETVAWGLGQDPPAPAAPQRYHMSVDLKLKNPGKVLVNYRVDSMMVLVNQQAYQSHMPILNWGGVIHPGGDTVFFYPYVVVPVPIPDPVLIEARYRILYWAVEGERRSLRASIQSEIPLSGGTGLRFLYRDGPTYERV